MSLSLRQRSSTSGLWKLASKKVADLAHRERPLALHVGIAIIWLRGRGVLKQAIHQPMRLMLGGSVRHVLLLHIPNSGMMHLLGQRKGMLLRGCCMLCREQSWVPLSRGVSEGELMASAVQLLLRPVSIMSAPMVNDFLL